MKLGFHSKIYLGILSLLLLLGVVIFLLVSRTMKEALLEENPLADPPGDGRGGGLLVFAQAFGESTAVRGGRRKKIYSITRLGFQVLEEHKRISDLLWESYAGVSPTKE